MQSRSTWRRGEERRRERNPFQLPLVNWSSFQDQFSTSPTEICVQMCDASRSERGMQDIHLSNGKNSFLIDAIDARSVFIWSIAN
jgi:hypothetical protein